MEHHDENLLTVRTETLFRDATGLAVHLYFDEKVEELSLAAASERRRLLNGEVRAIIESRTVGPEERMLLVEQPRDFKVKVFVEKEHELSWMMWLKYTTP